MTAEVIDQITGDLLSEAGSEADSLETFLLAILECHDGFCLDNESERVRLAAALAAALLTAGKGSVNQPVPPVEVAPPDYQPQTTGGFVLMPPPE